MLGDAGGLPSADPPLARGAPLKTLVIGRHRWPVSPERNELDYPVWVGLQQRLGGPVTLIVCGPVRATERRGTQELRFVLVPERYGAAGFFLVAARNAFAWARGTESPRVIVASEVVGGLVGSLVKRFRRTPFVMNIQGDVLTPGREYGSALKRYALRTASKVTVSEADSVRCLNETIASYVSSFRPEAHRIVLGSRVDTKRFTYRPPRGPIGTDGPLVICVGALIALKNQALLIRSVAIARARLPGIRLVLVGAGPERERLIALTTDAGIGPATEFLGQIPHERLPQVLASADLYASPSLSEGQPRSILEAQASGVPVIASDIPGHRDIISPGRTGLLLEDLVPDIWADAIIRLSRDDELRDSLSLTARALVERDHEFESQLDRFAVLISDTVDRASA